MINKQVAYEIIKSDLRICKCKTSELIDDTFHHNISLKNIPSALNHGILSRKMQSDILNLELTNKEKDYFLDDYHVNGLNCISLSSMNLDFSENYKDQFVYDYSALGECDIIISSKVSAYRNSTNYFNEFLVEGKIPTKYFKSIDIRVKNIIKNDCSLERLIELKRLIKSISGQMLENNIDIPLREVSDEIIEIDKVKVINMCK